MSDRETEGRWRGAPREVLDPPCPKLQLALGFISRVTRWSSEPPALLFMLLSVTGRKVLPALPWATSCS